jgi:teichuronic acid biosynthesis glycosyltransferase TuaC
MNDKNLLVLVPDYPDEHNKMIGSLFVKEQVAYLSKYFNQVYVIAPVLNAFDMTAQSKYCKDYKIDNISVYFPRCWFYPRAINLFPVSNYRKLSFDNRYSVIRKTIEKNNLKFDLIHSHMTFPATYAACKLKEEYHVPVVATIHEDSGWLKEEIDMNHEKLNYSWKNADILIRVNKTEIPLLQKYNKDVRFIPNGFTDTYMPLNQNLCRDLLELDKNQKFVFAYGYFDERKGFQTLIKAMSCIKDSDIKCYISGRGPYEPYLHNDIVGLGLSNKIKLLDFMSDIALCNWINASNLFIFPSLRESFGIVQINALACGSPVIASANVGSSEVICPACGELYNVGDVKDLANKIIQNIDKHWDHKGIRKYAELHYSWEGISNQLINLYKELI